MKENILTFGKHRGETVASLLESDPHYLKWLRWKRGIPAEIREEAMRLAIPESRNSDGLADLIRWNSP
jgi:hypothetical protein